MNHKVAVRFSILMVSFLGFHVRAFPVSQANPDIRAAGTISGCVKTDDKPSVGVAVIVTKSTTGQESPSVVAKAETNEEGCFRLSDVPPGKYVVTPFAPTHVVAERTISGEPGKSVSLEPGETVEHVDFSLVRGGVITGRVSDADDQPLIGKAVVVLPVDERGNRRPPQLLSTVFSTDDRGAYRIYGLQEGRYLVACVTESFRNRPVFHPGSVGETDAVAVAVKAGDVTDSIDIRVGGTAKTFSVSGRVVDASTGKPVPNRSCGHGVLNQTSVGPALPFSPAVTDAKGEFRIDGVAPGKYAAFCPPDGLSADYGEPAPFDVTDTDVTGLEIRLKPGVSVAGQVVLTGPRPPGIETKLAELDLRAFLIASEINSPFLPPVKIAPDGTFRLTGLRPGRLRLVLNPVASPKGFKLERIERDGVAQSDLIDIQADAKPPVLKVVMSFGTGVIRGHLKIVNGELPAGTQKGVFCYRTDGGARTPNPPVEVDAQGRFRVEGLSAGRYTITVRMFNPNLAVQPKHPPVVQTVVVQDGAETETILTLDLDGKNKGDGRP